MSAYSTLVLATTGLVGYWKLDEPSGTTATDAVGSNNGTTTGATPGAAGIVPQDTGTAYAWSADDQRVTIGTSAAFATDHVSIEAWFVATGTWSNDRPIVSRRVAAGGAGGYTFQTTPNEGEFNWYVVPNGGGFETVVTTGWTVDTVWHLVATYDGHRHRVYRNGVLLTTGGDYGAVLNKPANAVVEIGRAASASNAWRGTIDEVSIYSVALDDATVLAHYNAGVTAAGSSRINQQFQLRPY